MNRILFLLSILLFSTCSEKEKPVFTIQGQIENATSDYIILNQESDIERKIATTIDTIYLDNGGSFKAEFNNEPHYYTLVINESKKIPLVIDKDQGITINSDDSETKITGSKDTDLFMEYESLRKESLDRLVESIRKQISTENKTESPNPKIIDSLGKLELKNYDLHLEELNTFIKEKMGTSIALYPTSLRWKGKENIDFFDSLVTNFEEVHPNLKVTSRLKEKVIRLQQTAIGGIVPDIVLNTSEGKSVSLFSIHKKYTLIDFWASWCGPCRRESSLLANLYDTYKDSGFEIYGVSLDTNKKLWQNAVAKDKRIWANVSSLDGFASKAAYDFTITALPDNYLIDADGKIIAKNLHAEQLELLIDELMTK